MQSSVICGVFVCIFTITLTSSAPSQVIWANTLYKSPANVNPGLKFRISQTGLNYAAQQALGALSGKVQGQHIPDQHGEAHVKIGKVKYDITNMQVHSFSPGTAGVSVGTGGVTLSVSNVGASVHGDWHYEFKKGFIKIKDSGSFDVTVEGASISVGIFVGMDSPQSGRPTIKSTSCSSDVNNVKVKFHGGASWLYNLFDGNIAKALKGSLKNLLCKSAQDAINDNGSKEMAKLKVTVSLENMGELDYRLVAAPKFGSGFLESFHKGEVFYKGDHTEAPFQPAPMPDPQSHMKMVTIWVSDYLMNTMGLVLHKHGVLQYNLSAKDLPPKDRGVLNTTCTTLQCFGNILPSVVKEKYPNATVGIDMASSMPPTLNITAKGFHGNFAGYMNYSVILNNGSKVYLFSTLTTIDASLTAEMHNQKITAKVTEIKPQLKVVDSAIGKIEEATLNFIFTVAANTFIMPKLNEVGQKGFDLPNIDDVSYVNPTMTFLQNTVVLMTDVKYTPETKLYYRPYLRSNKV